jgi:hypothetical protein
MNWVRVRSSMTRKATRKRPMVMLDAVWKCLGASSRYLATRKAGRISRKK